MTELEVRNLKVGNTIFLHRPCPKCTTQFSKGKLYIEKDSYGMYVKCLTCGYEENIDPPTQQEKQDWGIK